MVLFQGKNNWSILKLTASTRLWGKAQSPKRQMYLGFLRCVWWDKMSWADGNPFASVLLGVPVRSHVPFLRASSSVKFRLHINILKIANLMTSPALKKITSVCAYLTPKICPDTHTNPISYLSSLWSGILTQKKSILDKSHFWSIISGSLILPTGPSPGVNPCDAKM